ncbi:MAG: VOC family protein [Cyclobacteriaceae bacterium]
MSKSFSAIDHIVYAVSELEAGMDHIEDCLGVRPVYGGKHPQQGTHNAIVAIGQSQYLEILAPDPDNDSIPPPRWMGIDRPGKDEITRWALKSDNINRDVKILGTLGETYLHTKEGQRMTATGDLLKWQLSMPSASPRIDVVPFLLDWGASQHPATGLDQLCKIISFDIYHTETAKINRVLQQLGSEPLLLPSEHTTMHLTLNCPKGLVTL